MDITSTMIRTLADHFRAPLPAAFAGRPSVADLLGKPIAEGWESLEANLVYPAIAIDAPVAGEREAHAPIALALLDVEGHPEQVDIVASVASVTQTLMVDIFADSQASRAEVLEALEASFAVGVLEDESHLCLPVGHQRIGFRRKAAPRFTDSTRGVSGDEWRAILEVEADADEIVVARCPRLVDLRLGIITQPSILATVSQEALFVVFAP